MAKRGPLIAIKLLHTLVWVFFNVVIFYLLYAVVVDKIDRWVWIGLGVVGLEALVLALFKMACPLTVVALRYADPEPQPANFDIYLPLWLARWNKLIYGSIMLCIMLGLAWRLAGSS